MPYVRLDTAKTTTGASNAYQWLGGVAHITCANFGTSGAIKFQGAAASSTGPFSDLGYLDASSTDNGINIQIGQGVWLRSLITVASSTGFDTFVN